MPLLDLASPIAALIDRIVPDANQRAQAKLALLTEQGALEMQALQTQMSAIIAEAGSRDPWTSRARPTFLYVMYVMILWSLPMGVVAAINPALAAGIVQGMNAYLNGLPQPLYELFGTGYLGYTAARQWGKVKGVDR